MRPMLPPMTMTFMCELPRHVRRRHPASCRREFLDEISGDLKKIANGFTMTAAATNVASRTD
jgi:hypothetical protein